MNPIPPRPYLGMQEFPVKNVVNLFQTGLKEMTAARGLLSTGRRLLEVPESGSKVYLIGERSEYLKIDFFDKNYLILTLYYLPGSHRLDIYDESGLVAVSERKKFVYLNCSEGLRRLGFGDIFKSLVSLV